MSDTKSPPSTRDKRPPGRPPKGTGPDWDSFLDALRSCPSIRRACEKAKVDRSSVRAKKAADQAFQEHMADALEDGVDTLVEHAWDRAINGWQPSSPDRDRPSDRLIEVLLRAHRPSVYALSIKLEGAKSLAELRATPDAELFALAARSGLRPEE